MDNIIKVGDFSIERKRRGYLEAKDGCKHVALVLLEDEHTVFCNDCKAYLPAFSVLEVMLDDLGKSRKNAIRLELRNLDILEESKKEHRWLKVLKDVQMAWRRPNIMAVCCPHCNRGILPKDGLGRSKISEEFELGQRRKNKNEKT